MPVLSPHRSSSSGLTGSYRSTFSASSLERPYYRTSTYTSPRFNSYSERYTTRSYADSDGRRIFSRSGSITEDGITTRFREESRDSSCGRRDSFTREIGSIRESSVLDTRRDSSLSRTDSGRNSSSSDVSRLSVVDSVADLRNKYSPSNYVPTVLRNKDISRSKTLNDIGLPPIESKLNTKKKVTEVSNVNSSSGVRSCINELPNNTNNCREETTDNMRQQEDDNGNRPSVSEMRKKFDGKERRPTSRSPLVVEGAGVRIAENRFKKLDGGSEVPVRTKKRETVEKAVNGAVGKSKVEPKKSTKFEKREVVTDAPDKRKSKIIEESKPIENGEKEVQVQRSVAVTNHVNNFASYIPSKDLEKEETSNNVEQNGELDVSSAVTVKVKKSKDISTSPRLNRSPVPQTNSTASSLVSNVTNNSCGSQRGSTERELAGKDEDLPSTRRTYERSSPARQMGLNGLKNIGNTCFMNSVIQCLSNTKPLLEYVKKDSYVSDINTTISSMKGALIKAFAQVLKELWSEDSSDRVVNTTSLKSQIQRFAPRFMGYSQQDAQEFLRYLLEGLHEDVNRVAAKPTPIHTEIDEKLSDSEKASESWQRYLRRENSKVVDIFVGQLKSTLKCTHCGHCSVTFDPFWDLSLPIPQKSGPIRLSQCLESFTREETLDGDEKPTCSKCKERRKCTKHFTIHKFPKILVIHLKRFSPTERFRGKLSVTVDFPLEGLDMSNYAAESHTQCRYNLYAISNHSGTTYSGHYTAYCRHPYSQTWHEYNDSRVSSISAKSVVSGEAYVLFYELDSKMAHL